MEPQLDVHHAAVVVGVRADRRELEGLQQMRTTDIGEADVRDLAFVVQLDERSD